MVTSFLQSFEKPVDAGAGLGERGRPALECLVARVGELACAYRPRDGLVPLTAHEPLLLKAAQEAAEVADVDPLVADQLGQAVEEVVAVGLPLAQEEQERGDLKALDPPALSVPSASSIHM